MFSGFIFLCVILVFSRALGFGVGWLFFWKIILFFVFLFYFTVRVGLFSFVYFECLRYFARVYGIFW